MGEDEKREDIRGTIYFFCTMLQGLVWGVGAAVLLTYTTGFNQTLVLMIIAGVVAAAIPMLGALFSAYAGFLFCSTLPVLECHASGSQRVPDSIGRRKVLVRSGGRAQFDQQAH